MSHVPLDQAYRVEVVTLPVSDAGKSLDFYTPQAGFSLDVCHPEGT